MILDIVNDITYKHEKSQCKILCIAGTQKWQKSEKMKIWKHAYSDPHVLLFFV
jgi:hypothetical protein